MEFFSNKVMVLDVGTKYIGICICDYYGCDKITFPTYIIEKNKDNFVHFLKLIARESIGTVVVGYPTRTDRKYCNTRSRIESFAYNLAKRTNAKIEFCNEDFSTKKAEKYVSSLKKSKGMNQCQIKCMIDGRSALIIAERYFSGLYSSDTGVQKVQKELDDKLHLFHKKAAQKSIKESEMIEDVLINRMLSFLLTDKKEENMQPVSIPVKEYE